MADTKVLQFLDLSGLQAYDAKSKQYIDLAVANGVATSLKGVAISEGKLLFYTDYPIDGATPSHEIELPETDLSGLLPKFEAATAGHVVTVAEDGKTIVDSGKTLNDYATKAELATTTATADEAKATVLALQELVGVIPEGYEATTIVSYIQEVAANIVANGYDDAELQAKVKSLEDALAVLNGEATVDGSVKKTVADEIAKVVAGAPDSLNDLKEISDWITSHQSDAAGMNSAISDNTKAIDALRAYLGELPEGATSTTVVEYISEVLENADLDKYALASDLTAAIGRIAANEQAISIINSSLAENGTIYNMIVNAQNTADAANTAVQTLTNYVGVFTTDDESITTLVQYIDARVNKVTSDIEARLAAVEAGLAEKASQSDLDALAERVSTNETNIGTNTTSIAELQATVESIDSIALEDIEKLFEQE